MKLSRGICKVCRSSFSSVGMDVSFGEWVAADDELWDVEGKVKCPIEGVVRDIHGEPSPDCVFRGEHERVERAHWLPVRNMSICEACDSFVSTREVEEPDGKRRVVDGRCLEQSMLSLSLPLDGRVPESCPFILEHRVSK